MSEYYAITPDDPTWPVQLNQLPDPPARLWVRGRLLLPSLATWGVSIIGSRTCTQYGSHVATTIAQDLCRSGFAIVSGGAFGIDHAAHRGALASSFGQTVVVLPCGIDLSYPMAHEMLYDAVLSKGGALISELEPGKMATRETLLARNRIIAALTPGTVLVEASVPSGSLACFKHARKLGRKLMVVPGPVTSAQSDGTLAQLREPDTIPVGSAQDVMEALKS